MAQKFYQKASVQTAIVSSIGVIIAAVITIAHYRSQLYKDNARLQNENTELLRENEKQRAEIQRLETKLTPFRTIAIEKYTLPEEQALKKLAEKIVELEDADRKKSEKISQLESELDHTKSLAEPCKLNLYSKNIKKEDDNYRVTLLFRPTKNERLGQLVFVADLPIDSGERILDFWPTDNTSPFLSSNKSKKIAENGKSARLVYSLLSTGYPSVDLVVSGPTKVRIKGNNGIKTFEIDVR